MKTKIKAWINLTLLIITLGINALGAFGVLNGMSQKNVSDKYPTLITPSPSTFSIWGVICMLLLISLVFMVIRQQEQRTAELIETISLPFWLASAANIIWIAAFSYEQLGLSVLLIICLIISLAVINRNLTSPASIGERINAAAFGLYIGWLIIAVVVNVAAFLVQIRWDRFGLNESTWTLITLIASLLIAILIQLRLRNALLTLPLAWAYVGIWQQHRPSGIYLGQFRTVGLFAIIFAGVFVIISFATFVINGYCLLPKKRGLLTENRP